MVDRIFGAAGQAAIHALRRLAAKGLTEVVEPTTGAAILLTSDVLRRQVDVPGSAATQVATVWKTVPGLEGIETYVRLSGIWKRAGEDRSVQLREDERVATLFDVPATGAGDEAVPASVLTTRDRIRYVDPVYGEATFEIREARARVGAGLVTALLRYARED